MEKSPQLRACKEIMTVRPTSRPTERPGQREVTRETTVVQHSSRKTLYLLSGSFLGARYGSWLRFACRGYSVFSSPTEQGMYECTQRYIYYLIHMYVNHN